MRPLHRQLRPLQLEVQIRWRHSIQVGGNRDEQNYAESVAFSVTGDIRNLSQARHIKENDVQNQIVESERAWKTLQPMLSSTLQERHEGEVNPPKGSILVKLHLEGSDDGRAAQRELSLRVAPWTPEALPTQWAQWNPTFHNLQTGEQYHKLKLSPTPSSPRLNPTCEKRSLECMNP